MRSMSHAEPNVHTSGVVETHLCMAAAAPQRYEIQPPGCLDPRIADVKRGLAPDDIFTLPIVRAVGATATARREPRKEILTRPPPGGAARPQHIAATIGGNDILH